MTNVDFTQYVAPGVYVEDNTSTPIVTTVGVPESVVCLIGPAVGYQIATEGVRISVTPQTAMAHRGAYLAGNTPGYPAPVVKKTDGTTLVLNTDYELEADLSEGGGASNAVLLINRKTGSSAIADGDLVIVTYYYTDSLYYTPLAFDDYDTLVNVYGAPVLTSPQINPLTSQVVSHLSLAAKLAFENGANRVVAVATDTVGDTRTYAQQLTDAYDKIIADQRINIVVPLFVDEPPGGPPGTDGHTFNTVRDYINDLRTHLEDATAGGIGRIGIVGLARKFNDSGSGSTGFDTLASDALVVSSRIMVAYPNQMNYYNGLTNQVTVIDGIYLAAAYAGRLAALPVQYPLTKQNIRGFAGVPVSILGAQTKTFKDSLSSAGVAVAEVDRFNRLSVRHGVTTDPSSLITREISIVRARDALLFMLQEGSEQANLVGTPIGVDTLLTVKGVIAGILENATSTQVIVAYQDLKVRQRSVDPSVIEVKFAYKPAVPLNYIVISFSIDLTTGQTDSLATA